MPLLLIMLQTTKQRSEKLSLLLDRLINWANVASNMTGVGWLYAPEPTEVHKQACHLVRIFCGATTKPNPDIASWDAEPSGAKHWH